MAIAVAILVTFIGGLYFITHNQPEDVPLLPGQKTSQGNGLPPKPEERWRYIKELENRQIGVTQPTEPSAGGEVQSQTQLTNEQRQLLEQMQADMRQQPTKLPEVPYNDQTQIPRSQVTITPPVSNVPPPQQQSRPVVPQQTHTKTQPVQQQQVQAPPKVEKEQPKEKTQRWMLQCGSFKGLDQAESVRAQLAFAGIESRITTGGGWNRVVLGPYGDRAAADKMLQRIRGTGMSSCIPLSVGG